MQYPVLTEYRHLPEKKPRSNGRGFWLFCGREVAVQVDKILSQMKIIITGSVGYYGRVEQLTAGDAFPGIEAANEVVEFFRIHLSSTFRASHFFLLQGYDDHLGSNDLIANCNDHSSSFMPKSVWG
jgi:hypothetical protein